MSSIASMDGQLLVNNVVGTARAAVVYGVPIVHSTVNVKTGLNKPPIPQLRKVLEKFPTYDARRSTPGRTSTFVPPSRPRGARN